MKLLPDTNILIYETVEDSEHHKEAYKLIDQAKQIFIPSIIIHEYFWVAPKLGINIKIVLAKISEYLEDPRVYYFAESLDIYRNAVKMLLEDGKQYRELNDYIILAVAYKEKLTIATYDHELRKAAIRRNMKIIP